MKALLSSIIVGIVALTLTARGEDLNTHSKAKSKTQTQATATTRSTSARGGAMVRSHANVSTRPMYRSYRSYSSTPRTDTVAKANANTHVRTYRDRNISANASVSSRNNVAVNRDRNFTVNRERNAGVNRNRNLMVNHERNVTVNRTNNYAINRTRNVAVTNNWRSSRFSGQRYAAFRNYHRQWHDRGWWRSHFSTIVFVGGGWWYWDAGYWFPAWGYAPYTYYPYDGPIYTGYAGLAPDRVIVEVQSQLQRDGYYAGPIDGVLGPMTRQAIADFQADHGLATTASIDEPTLDTLGIS
jgi:Putative peptidoglycan binding domain